MSKHLDVKKKVLIIDFSASAYASFHASTDDTKSLNEKEKKQFWKYLFLNNIKKLKNKFKPDELIIAFDSNSWRKSTFQYYKANRQIDRDKSSLDWPLFFECLEEFKQELEEFFPYMVISVKNAEGDDIIAVITHTINNICGEILIASGDKDFKQLLKYKNVKLYSPRYEKYLTTNNADEELIRLILSGDKSDGIPNVVNPDDSFINIEMVYSGVFKTWLKKKHKIDIKKNDFWDKKLITDYYRETGKDAKIKKRQESFGAKKIDEVLMYGLEKFLSENKLIKERFERNKKLIALDRNNIPESVWDNIVDVYNNYTYNPKNYMTIQKYFASNKMRTLLEDVNLFL